MRGAYVILTHTHVPVNEGPNKGKFQVHEMVEFVDAVRNKHSAQATAIMDVQKRKLLKNRAKDSGATYELLEAHVVKGYKEKYREFLNLVGAEIPEILEEKVADEVEDAIDEKPKKKARKKKVAKKETDATTDTD